MEKQKILSWPEIEASIQKAIEKPYDEHTPLIIPRQAALFRTMLSLCEFHTGILPNRVNNSADSTLVAYYFYFADNCTKYGVIEIWQGIEKPEENLETVLGWHPPKKDGIEWEYHAEDLTLAQAIDGKQFNAMVDALTTEVSKNE